MIKSRKALLFIISLSIMFFGSAMVMHSLQVLLLESVDIALSMLGGVALTAVLLFGIIEIHQRNKKVNK